MSQSRSVGISAASSRQIRRQFEVPNCGRMSKHYITHKPELLALLSSRAIDDFEECASLVEYGAGDCKTLRFNNRLTGNLDLELGITQGRDLN